MKNFLFSPRGRIARSAFWKAALVYVAAAGIVFGLLAALWQVIPGQDVDGNFSVEGARAIPYLILIFGYLGLCVWSGICVGMKRYHDRGKSGAWILIQLVPIVGPLWYLIEAGFLRGTEGPNRYGAEPA